MLKGLAAVALALSLAGCGEAGTADEVPRLTASQLEHRMSRICQEHSEYQVVAIERFARKRGIPYGPNAEDATDSQLELELVEVMLPIVRDTIHDLEELRPSPAQEATFEEFLRALEHGVKASEADPSWLVTGDSEPFYRARTLSWKLGTALCGQA